MTSLTEADCCRESTTEITKGNKESKYGMSGLCGWSSSGRRECAVTISAARFLETIFFRWPLDEKR